MAEHWKSFMLESNQIEGENRLNPDDESAFHFALVAGDAGWTLEDVCLLHALLGKYLKKEWVGKWRKCNVRVGNYIAPRAKSIPRLMRNYMIDLSNYNSYQAHNRFEQIHPFRDLNGRVGRLIWLSKAVNEGYNFEIPFLQKYYYQTLSQSRK